MRIREVPRITWIRVKLLMKRDMKTSL